MSLDNIIDTRSDRLAARAVGTGIGLLALMVTWLIGNRVLSMVLGAPVGPTIAFVIALAVGAAVSVVAARRLAGIVAAESGSHHT